MGHRVTARQRHCVSDRAIRIRERDTIGDSAGVDRGPRIALLFVDECFRSDGESRMASGTRRKTRLPKRIVNDAREKNLVEVLDQARDEALARLRALRKEEQEDAVELPADGLDVARSLEDVETDAGLIERYEYRLRDIDDAFSRLERGRYGLCEKCRQEIPVERLRAVPFAAYCIDCQAKRNERRRPGEGDVDEPSRHVWTPPGELRESVDE